MPEACRSYHCRLDPRSGLRRGGEGCVAARLGSAVLSRSTRKFGLRLNRRDLNHLRTSFPGLCRSEVYSRPVNALEATPRLCAQSKTEKRGLWRNPAPLWRNDMAARAVEKQIR